MCVKSPVELANAESFLGWNFDEREVVKNELQFTTTEQWQLLAAGKIIVCSVSTVLWCDDVWHLGRDWLCVHCKLFFSIHKIIRMDAPRSFVFERSTYSSLVKGDCLVGITFHILNR